DCRRSGNALGGSPIGSRPCSERRSGCKPTAVSGPAQAIDFALGTGVFPPGEEHVKKSVPLAAATLAAAALESPPPTDPTTTANKLAEHVGADEDADYLTGMALGAASSKGKIGFVAPFPIPEVIREINAVALGAQTTHPGANVQVVWTNTWFDPTKEKQAAQSLLSRGVDAIGQGQDSPATGEAA